MGSMVKKCESLLRGWLMFSKDELAMLSDALDVYYFAEQRIEIRDLHAKVKRLLEYVEQPKPPYKPNLPGFSRV